MKNNKQKIWFFGDSYAAIVNKEIAKTSWTVKVNDAFPNYQSINLAKSCSSLDYLYYVYDQNRKNFKKNDIVILTLTSFYRIWLDTNDDGDYFANPSFRTTSKGVVWHKKKERYYDFFASPFYNIKAIEAFLNLFLDALQHDARTDGIKTIVLPIAHFSANNITDIQVAKTSFNMNLTWVSDLEILKTFKKLIPNLPKGTGLYSVPEILEFDGNRSHHLSPENNTVLAEKVINYIKNNEEIDLTVGWKI